MANTTIVIVRKYKKDGLFCLLFPEDTCKGQTPFCSNEVNHALYCWGEADYRTMIALTNPATEEEAAELIATARRDENQHGDGRTFVFRKRYKFANRKNRLTMEAKTYSLMSNVGKCKYLICYYSGERFNRDGSMAQDVAIFKNKQKANAFVIDLQKQGYSGNGIY